MDPNIKSKITTFLEDNIQENPDDLILSMEMTFYLFIYFWKWLFRYDKKDMICEINNLYMRLY